MKKIVSLAPALARRTFVCSFAMLTLACSCISAEEIKQNTPLSLKDCIAIAMRGNIDVLTAQNNIVAARSRLANARSSYLPQVSLQNNAFTWGSEGVLNKVTTGTALTVEQNVFDGGLREANAQSARYGVLQSAAGLSRTQQTVVFNVSEAYYNLLRARHLADVAQANVTYNEGLREQIHARAEEGESAKVDVLPIEAQLAGARVSLLSAKNKVRTSAIQLQNLMGLTSRMDFDIQDVDNDPVVEVHALEDYVKAALESRPDITQGRAATGAARASVRSARISLYPRPTISANYQRQVSGGFTTSGSQIVGGIVFDIFNGGANRAAYREAKAGQANAQLQEQQIDRDIRSQVEEAYLNLTSAKERMVASAASLTAANNNYEAQKERYAQGLGTTLDMLNAEVQVVTAQSDEVQARYDYYTAIAQMDYAVGRQEGGAR